jgi:hypothetical protein
MVLSSNCRMSIDSLFVNQLSLGDWNEAAGAAADGLPGDP